MMLIVVGYMGEDFQTGLNRGYVSSRTKQKRMQLMTPWHNIAYQSVPASWLGDVDSWWLKVKSPLALIQRLAARRELEPELQKIEVPGAWVGRSRIG